MPTLTRLTLLAGLPLALLTPTSMRAQSPTDARAAYAVVQRMRQVADSLGASAPAAALDTLSAALRYLERPDVRDLAQGWPYLRSRTPNVWADVAHWRLVRGDTAGALDALEAIERSGGTYSYLQYFAHDSLLSRLLAMPRGQALAAQLAAQRRTWSDSAFSTPFRPQLSEDERVAGLAQLWAEVRYAFPDFDRRPGLSWDSLFLAYLPRVRAAASTQEYYLALQSFIAQLHDGHSNVYPPRALWGQLARPPLRTGLVEGHVLVLGVPSPAIRALGVHVGDEVVAVDGTPVREYAAQRVTPYQSSSTPQNLDVRVYGYSLLAGPEARPVRLTLRGAGGADRAVTLARSGYTDVPPARTVIDSLLPGNVGYLRVDGFESNSVVPQLRAALQRLAGTRGLVVDVRANGGGSSDVGYALLRWLAERPFPTSLDHALQYTPLYRAWGFGAQLRELMAVDTMTPDTSLRYRAPVAVLAGPATFSAAEDFLVAYRQMGRGPIVGEASAGSTGQPLQFPLPGGGSGRVRTKHDSFADGREFDGIGIQPDILVHPTVAGVRAGRDEALQAALRYLQHPPASP